jgi:murein DD-endopeptidase MepM/ murein hydrolase activator NlpD
LILERVCFLKCYNETHSGSPFNPSLPNPNMKSIRNYLIAVFLGLLLAGWNWQVVRAPQGESNALPATAFAQDGSAQNVAEVPEQTALPAAGSQPASVDTEIPEKSVTPSAQGFTTATPDIGTYSCSNGTVGSGEFVWPTDNHSLSGNNYGVEHPGIDLAAGEGSAVYAADAGIVIAAGNDTATYGNMIQIDHGNGYLTVYAHLSVIGVKICQSVDAGQWIGGAGSTGNAQGAHLHFEIAYDGSYVNPWNVLP